ncbi:hypothetical protein NON20_13225 [Synechocystis sp. B12]|nr:hypothetical protein NON20_13225 [Synechocystis sp. B12]
MPSILGDRRLNRRLTPIILSIFRDKVARSEIFRPPTAKATCTGPCGKREENPC